VASPGSVSSSGRRFFAFTMITVCALMYGNHERLARRCLEPIVSSARLPLVSEIRIGLNEVCDGTRDYVFDALRRLCKLQGIPSFVVEPESNAMKYPVMRMLFNAKPAIYERPYVMWWDDDSCMPRPDPNWWQQVVDAMDNSDMIGDLWRLPLQGKQADAIEKQPWYAGRSLRVPRYRYLFATGGWWTIRSEILKKWDYPWPELNHRGGDCLLGELMRQQGLRLRNFRENLWINADDLGGQSKAPRRGFDEAPLWKHYRPDDPKKGHHAFAFTQTTIAPTAKDKT
jgi:hypothetical protein